MDHRGWWTGEMFLTLPWIPKGHDSPIDSDAKRLAYSYWFYAPYLHLLFSFPIIFPWGISMILSAVYQPSLPFDLVEFPIMIQHLHGFTTTWHSGYQVTPSKCLFADSGEAHITLNSCAIWPVYEGTPHLDPAHSATFQISMLLWREVLVNWVYNGGKEKERRTRPRSENTDNNRVCGKQILPKVIWLSSSAWKLSFLFATGDDGEEGRRIARGRMKWTRLPSALPYSSLVSPGQDF